MGQVHAKEALSPASAGGSPSEDTGEIPLSEIKAKCVSVSVDGVTRTKNDVILESVSDLFKVEDFEDLVLTSQNVRGKLEDLGCFSKVGIHIDTSNTGNKDYTVTYQVEENKRVTGSVNTMVGNNEGSLMTGVKFPNVLGRGEKLQADYTYGTKKTSNFNISLVKPLRGKLKTNLTGNIYQSNGEYQQSGFKELDRGLLADLAFRSAPNVSHNLQYEAVWRNISSLNRAAAFSVREHSGHTLKSAIRHILCVDRRDDKIFPKEGTLFKLNQEFAGLGGNVGFFKNELELQANLPLTEDITLQGAFNAGLLKDFQGEKSFNIADHFFLGGPLNVRGFDTRGIGPSSEGSSLGGSLFWSSGLHLYAPLPFRPEMRGFADNFKTHVFLTAGNLGNFRLSGDMGKNIEHVTQDFRLSYGLGLAVKLGGVARIELNYCVPVKASRGDKPMPGLQFGVGVHFL